MNKKKERNTVPIVREKEVQAAITEYCIHNNCTKRILTDRIKAQCVHFSFGSDSERRVVEFLIMCREIGLNKWRSTTDIDTFLSVEHSHKRKDWFADITA